MGEPQYSPQDTSRHEALHRDISLANIYRLEGIKHLMSLAAAVLAFTVTFMNDVIPTGNQMICKDLVGIGWGLLILSLIAGLGHFMAWDRFYISYRDYAKNIAGGKKVRKCINIYRRIAMWSQIATFIIGLALISIFCFLNL